MRGGSKAVWNVSKNSSLRDSSCAILEVNTGSKQVSDQILAQKWLRNRILSFLAGQDWPNCTFKLFLPKQSIMIWRLIFMASTLASVCAIWQGWSVLEEDSHWEGRSSFSCLWFMNYTYDHAERHLVATEKEVAKSNLTICKLDVFAILVSGKLYALVQQDLTRKGSN